MMTLLEICERQADIIKLQAEIIQKQAEIIEQNNIADEFAGFRAEAAALRKCIEKELN